MLSQCDDAELRVTASASQICIGHAERIEAIEAVLSKRRELTEQIRECAAHRRSEHRFAIERRERDGVPVLKDVFDARNPVRAFAVDQVTGNIEWAPGVGSFVATGPFILEIVQKRSQHDRCSFEDRSRVPQLKLHD